MALPPLDASQFGPLTRLRAGLIFRWVAANNRRAETRLRSMPDLWRDIQHYIEKSSATGASMSDYLTLYEEVRRLKPVEILELGTGVSTVVLVHALMDNHADGAPMGRVTSMEESGDWTAMARSALPPHIAPYAELIHSPKVDGIYKMFRGVQYTEIPDRSYDFVFSDGPQRHSPVNGDKLFDLDLIQIVRRSERVVNAVVDNHYLTFYVLQKVFGPELARYDVSKRLMFVGPVSNRNVRHLKKENFLPDLRLFGRTELKLRMALDD
ncbi:MAG TPA: hypothetical protein VKN63_05805 [Afifellaceae bacterium]|nr:hypothetical protein [Afifellaceae bacterium]